MFVRNFFQAARLINQSNSLVGVRSISTTPLVAVREAPPAPILVEEPGNEWDPKVESLESFLNIRFGPNFPTINDDKNPQRDLKNFPRPVRADFAEPTRLGIFPESWFNAFYNKTGVTGPYVFLGTFGTFLLSKEWLVFEHEILVGMQVTLVLVALTKTFGPDIRKSLCEKADKIEQEWDDWQQNMIKFLNDFIQSEKKLLNAGSEQKILFDAKRENIQLQLEAEFRRRQMHAYNEVRRRLEFLVAREEAQRQFQQAHMVEWIINNVAKSISSQSEKDTLKSTLADLRKLAAKSTI